MDETHPSVRRKKKLNHKIKPKNKIKYKAKHYNLNQSECEIIY